jgi:hypothetical protein
MLESDMRATGTLPVELGAQVIDKCGGDFKASEEISAPTTLDFAERQKIVQNTMDNFAITASNPRFAADLSGAENVCFDLQAKNNGTSDASPTGIYRLAIPSGVVTFENNLVSIDQLVFPQVIPGAVSSGTKCFPTQGERGNFTIKISLVSLMEVEIPIDVS